MPACPPGEFSAWLFERLKDSELCDFIPLENLHLIIERGAFFFLKENRFHAEGLVEWLQEEYQVPAETVTACLSSLIEEAREKLQVEISFQGADMEAAGASGPGEKTEEKQAPAAKPTAAPESGDEVVAWEETKKPAPETESREPGEPESKEKSRRPGLESSRVTAAADAGAKKAWQVLPPRPKSGPHNLVSFLASDDYFEYAFLERAHGGWPGPDELLKRILGERFSFSEQEKEVYRNSTIEPGTKGDEILDWALRINGLALAYFYARERAPRADAEHKQEWVNALRQLNAKHGKMASLITAKLIQAKKQGGPEAKALEAAAARLQEAHDLAERAFNHVCGAPKEKPAPSPTRDRPSSRPTAQARTSPRSTSPDEKEQGLRGALNRHSNLFIILSAAVFVACILFVLKAAGLFGASGAEKLNVDFSGLPVEVLSATAQGPAMVVVIKESDWSGLAREEKESLVEQLYNKASEHNLSQVQLRTEKEGILAQVWSPSNYRFFQ